MSSPRITYVARPNATPEGELEVLAAVYKFVLFDSQVTRGGPHDLTSESSKNWTTRLDKKGTDNADLHSD